MSKKTEDLPGMEKAINTELAGAIEDLKASFVRRANQKEEHDLIVERVVMEMKKAGKDLLRVSVDGLLFDIEITRTKEKLKFAKAKF